MQTKSFRNLGDLCRSVPVRNQCRTFSLDDARRLYGSRNKRKVYYICEGLNGTRIFGIVGTANMLRVPERLYEALNYPTVDTEILLRRVFYTNRSISS